MVVVSIPPAEGTERESEIGGQCSMVCKGGVLCSVGCCIIIPNGIGRKAVSRETCTAQIPVEACFVQNFRPKRFSCSITTGFTSLHMKSGKSM